jgi:hypothetical protein
MPLALIVPVAPFANSTIRLAASSTSTATRPPSAVGRSFVNVVSRRG